LPIAVLVNLASASASEIVAACLQDHGRAVVIGERTWGKGTVQNIIPVEGGRSMLRLTIASYWRPSNKNIHRLKSSQETDEWGVKPSEGYEVKMGDKDLVNWLEARRKRDVVRHVNPGEKPIDPPAMDDPVLDKAVDYLDKKLGIKPEDSATG
jgi:carboxyl-terminal processing protease